MRYLVLHHDDERDVPAADMRACGAALAYASREARLAAVPKMVWVAPAGGRSLCRRSHDVVDGPERVKGWVDGARVRDGEPVIHLVRGSADVLTVAHEVHHVRAAARRGNYQGAFDAEQQDADAFAARLFPDRPRARRIRYDNLVRSHGHPDARPPASATARADTTARAKKVDELRELALQLMRHPQASADDRRKAMAMIDRCDRGFGVS